MSNKIKTILTIAGSDPGAGAGIQSDLKTFKNHGLYGLTVITTITAQNTQGVTFNHSLRYKMVASQLNSVLSDFKPAVAKIGVLGEAPSIKAISFILKRNKQIRVVYDPVIRSKNNFLFLNELSLSSIKKYLFKILYLITPNLFEAQHISGLNIYNAASLESAMKKIYKMGCKNVLVKGGHFDKRIGIPAGTDILYNGGKFTSFSGPFIKTKNTHGIGCTFSAAIASNLALGHNLKESISNAKKYVIKSLQKKIKVGTGIGPVEI